MSEQERATVRAAVAAADKVIRCRVCGALMTPENTVDPVEVPDECGDCFTGEFPGLFD